MNVLTKRVLAIISIVVSTLLVPVNADDIDIINKPNPIKTNVLFIMDMSGSMAWEVDSTKLAVSPVKSRLEVLKGAFQDVVNAPEFDDINIGLSVFSGSGGDGESEGVAQGISFPISPVDGKKAQASLSKGGENPFVHKGISYMPEAGTLNTRKYLRKLSNDSKIWRPGGATPIVDALFEAARYFRGEDVYWGRQTADDIRAAHPSSYTGLLENKLGTPKCDSPLTSPNNRISCTKDSNCGVTQHCKTTKERQRFPDTSVGTNCTPIIEQMICGEGQTSCGTGMNCTDSPQSVGSEDRECESIYKTTSDIPSCLAAHPTWSSCSVIDIYDHVYDNEGHLIASNVVDSKIVCVEEIKRYFCDSTTIYSCEIDVESCTRCPGEISKVVGSAIYKTPIIEKCPANGIILLSDGQANTNHSQSNISSMIGSDYADKCTAESNEDEACGVQLAKFLANEDQNGSIKGKQTVSTFTVGFALSKRSSASDFLKSLATAGNGSYFDAKNRAELILAFKQAISSIDKQARSFSSPTYTVNTTTQLTHGKYVYVPVFDRAGGVAWQGNIKKFQLKDGKLFGLDASSTLVEAIDSNGKMNLNVQDLWSKANTGAIVETGGAASLLDPAKRKLYTNNGSSGVLADLSSVSITDLNVADVAEKDKVLDYIKGLDSKGDPRHHMGDIIHSKPIVVQYSKKESVLFVGTNEGFLHAFKTTEDITDTTDGQELFAFMPDALIKNIKKQYDNAVTPYHLYGLDGPIKYWLDDKDGDGINDVGEDAYLFFGLRRGGKSYYALKLGDKITDKPTLAWKLDDKTPGFEDLGFTWSEPVLERLRYEKGGVDTKKPVPVLVFGGGYVDDHSTNPKVASAKNVIGSTIFIVDALDGSKIYSPPKGAIEYAVPSKIRAIDANRNGSIDRLYFGDTGGNVWRIDLGDKTNYLDMGKSIITHFAKLGDDRKVDGPDSRKFFVEPDVAFMKHNGRYALSVAIGSGSRPDPLGKIVNNHFFVLLDKDVFYPPEKSKVKTITMNDLLDAPVPPTVDLVAKLNETDSKKGWKMNLKPKNSLTGLLSEKVLSGALTYDNKVMFTTLGLREVTPLNYNNMICGLNQNTVGNLYVLDLMTGSAVLDFSGDKKVKDPEDRSISLVAGEILETPQIIYKDFAAKDGGDCTKDDCSREYTIHAGKGPSVVGSLTITNKKVPSSKKLPRVYWLDEGK